jgi:hypothetical protein
MRERVRLIDQNPAGIQKSADQSLKCERIHWWVSQRNNAISKGKWENSNEKMEWKNGMKKGNEKREWKKGMKKGNEKWRLDSWTRSKACRMWGDGLENLITEDPCLWFGFNFLIQYCPVFKLAKFNLRKEVREMQRQSTFANRFYENCEELNWSIFPLEWSTPSSELAGDQIQNDCKNLMYETIPHQRAGINFEVFASVRISPVALCWRNLERKDLVLS